MKGTVEEPWLTVLAGIAALALAMGIGRFAYTALLPAMRAEGLGDATAGLIAGANLFAYMAGAWWAGTVPLTWRKRVFALSLAVSVLSTLGMALPASTPLWLAIRIISGLACAGAIIQGSSLFLERLTQVGRPDMGVVTYSGVGVGIALSGLVAASGGPDLSAGWAWTLLAGIAALLALPALLLARGRSTWHSGGGEVQKPEGGLTLRRLFAGYFMQGLGYTVTATFLVAVVARGTGDRATAGWAWVITGLATVPGSVVWSRLAKRLGTGNTLAIAHCVQAVAMVLPVLSDGALPAYLSAFGFGSPSWASRRSAWPSPGAWAGPRPWASWRPSTASARPSAR